METLKYSGSGMFRQRIVASILSNRPLRIDHIRSDSDTSPGLLDFEANFLRLIEKLTDGCRIEINETGTVLRFRPGVLIGGKHDHDCGCTRSVGWFIEALIPLAPFCKVPLVLTLRGVTNDDLDLSVDTLVNVTLPLLQNFGIYNSHLKIKQRGAPPGGGGLVELAIPPVRASLRSIYLTDVGLIKRVRGVAYSAHVSPTILTRVIDSSRGILNDFLPDVYINSDHYKGRKEGGASPGYAVSLVAETTAGALISTERTARCRRTNTVPGTEEFYANIQGRIAELPEDIGREAAFALLDEIYSGGVVDSAHQPLILQLMVLTPEDVSKVRFGALTPQTINSLRLLKDAFGVTFKITKEAVGRFESQRGDRDEDSKDESGSEENADDEEENTGESPALKQASTFVLTCVGTGFVNTNRKAT